MESDSIIYTGSEMNHRTFGENESWNSLQSTVLAGNLEIDEQETKKSHNNLSIVNEENSSVVLIPEEDENFLNVNLDALGCSGTDLFQANEADSPMKSGIISFPDTVESHDSGIGQETTGFLLKRMMEDIDRYASHSTPSYDIKSNHHLADTVFNFDTEFVTLNSISLSNSEQSNTSKNYARPRVACIKKFFESQIHDVSHFKTIKKTSPTIKVLKMSNHLKKSKIPTLKKSSGNRSGLYNSKSNSAQYSENKSVQIVPDERLITVRKKNVSMNKSTVSSIMGRKSLVGVVSSPIKSVQVIRKIFSPSPNKDKAEKKSFTNSYFRTKTTVPATKKKNKPHVPKITVISCD